MSINDLSPRDFDRFSRQQREQKAIEPAMDARRKIENREIETDFDLSIEAEVDRVMREFKAA